MGEAGAAALEMTEAARRSLDQGGTNASTYRYRVRRSGATPPSSDPEKLSFARSAMPLGVATVSTTPAAGVSAVSATPAAGVFAAVRSTARRVASDASLVALVARDDSGAPQQRLAYRGQTTRPPSRCSPDGAAGESVGGVGRIRTSLGSCQAGNVSSVGGEAFSSACRVCEGGR